MECMQQLKPVKYKKGQIVNYTGYEGDLINHPSMKPSPKKYFKVVGYDEGWGTVSYKKYNFYGDVWKNTIGVANIRKTNLIGKIKWLLFWGWKK